MRGTLSDPAPTFAAEPPQTPHSWNVRDRPSSRPLKPWAEVELVRGGMILCLIEKRSEVFKSLYAALDRFVADAGSTFDDRAGSC